MVLVFALLLAGCRSMAGDAPQPLTWWSMCVSLETCVLQCAPDTHVVKGTLEGGDYYQACGNDEMGPMGQMVVWGPRGNLRRAGMMRNHQRQGVWGE